MLTEPFKVADQEVFVTISVGISSYPSDDADAEQLVKCAETAAYCARQQGRNTVLYYSPAMNAKAFERLTLETGLRRALERDELIVHYQPRIDIASGRTVGFEALVRWRHPEFGLVSPAQFIPLAEETGLIVPIGAWILEQACRQTRRWQEAGLPQVRIAVNLSSVQFRQPDLFETVQGALERSGLEPRWLELELTESLLMQNPENAVLTLQRLSGRGIHLSIDDFGTGYSSLSYLKRFPIHSLKIDQTFIRELTTNPDDAAIATSIILMGKSLKLRVVAEGVETRSQLSFLRVMQCHEAQGYLFSPPVAAAEAEAFLRKNGQQLGEVA
jgi:EAL domain-containing protein (putative c-di-GMP-specific phosphodiesterase class I)